MITKTEEIPITEFNYPFASAEKYCGLSKYGYKETEYYMYGTANVYQSSGELGEVEIMKRDAPYINRFIVRAPVNPACCSGNIVVEIINPTSFMEIDRMWILGRHQFLRNGDIYVGITSKPNTIEKLVEFNPERYGRLSWKNPSPERAFPFDAKQMVENGHLPDLNPAYETGLFWDMLTDLAWLLRSDSKDNPLRDYQRDYLYLTGWSQSACYLFRYINSFAYRPEVARGSCVFDGYLSGGGIRSLVIPVNQYESAMKYSFRLRRVEKVRQPFIAVQTESENGRFESSRTMRDDSDREEFLYRLYEVAGASHDTMYSYVDYYCQDEDLRKIGCLPEYVGNHTEGNDYPSQILFAAAFRNLFYWAREGVAPRQCPRVQVDADGENIKDAFGNTVGGLRTCLLDCPTGRYYNTSSIMPGKGMIDNTDKDGLFGHQEAFPPEMLSELYGSLDNYRSLAERHTREQISKGFICKEDAEKLVDLAVELAEKRGLKAHV